MSLCILIGAGVKALAVTAFTLGWTHSVEKTRWEEDWRVTPGGLELVEARVKSSGAGMEPPPEARLAHGWWRWRPDRPPLAEIVLRDSGAAGFWELCHEGGCEALSQGGAGDVIRLKVCEPRSTAADRPAAWRERGSASSPRLRRG